MKTTVAALAGLAFGMLVSSLTVTTGCSCPPGQDMISIQSGTYVADDPSVEADYRLEIAHSETPAIERYTHDGKQVEVIYRGRPDSDADSDGGSGD